MAMYEPGKSFRGEMQRLADQVYAKTETGKWWDDALTETSIQSTPPWRAVQKNYRTYPSGGSSSYESHAVWDGSTLTVDQRNGTIRWETIAFSLL